MLVPEILSPFSLSLNSFLITRHFHSFVLQTPKPLSRWKENCGWTIPFKKQRSTSSSYYRQKTVAFHTIKESETLVNVVLISRGLFQGPLKGILPQSVTMINSFCQSFFCDNRHVCMLVLHKVITHRKCAISRVNAVCFTTGS